VAANDLRALRCGWTLGEVSCLYVTGARIVDNAGKIVSLVVLGFVLITIVLLIVHFTRRCPKCKKPLALKITGNEKGHGFYHKYELVCRKCLHRIWRNGSNKRSIPFNSGG